MSEAYEDGYALSGRAVRALDETDNMPAPLRGCVHEFGYAIVKACLHAGVKKPENIRQLVYEVWMGARQPNQTGHRKNKPSPIANHLDWVLIQAGADLSAKTLLRLLWQSGMVILPREPGSVMLKASMAEMNSFNVRCTKEEKHRRRLKAAIDAQARRLWPHLFDKKS